MDSLYIYPACVRRLMAVDGRTLHRWSNQGILRSIVTPGGHHLYHRDDVYKLLPDSTNQRSECRVNVCYARVSSLHQKEDLQRQIDYLRESYPGH